MSADLLEMATAYQRTALLAAVNETGIADTLAEGRSSAEAIATACGTDPRGTAALLSAMVATGLADHSDGGYALTEAGAPLASSHPESVAEIVAKEHFFYRAWGELTEAVLDGHARIPAWRQRLAEDPETALSFLRALDDLASPLARDLALLTGVDGPCQLLDVGGGAGSHAAALAAAVPGLQATVVDLPAVEPLLRERHPDLAFLPGDLDQPRFGVTTERCWDVVLLANILHDFPAGKSARYVRTAATLLRPAGTLLIYEWLLDRDRLGPREAVFFNLMMLVENEGGCAWTADEIGAWMTDAGLVNVEVRRNGGPIAVLRARAPGAEDNASKERL